MTPFIFGRPVHGKPKHVMKTKQVSLGDIMSIPGLTTKKELAALSLLSRQCAGTKGYAVELGTYQGRSTAALCRGIGSEWVVSIDNYKMQHHEDNSLSRAHHNLTRLGYSPLLIEGESTVVPPLLKSRAEYHPVKHRSAHACEGSVILLFIDTDHRADPLLKELSVWHDYLMLGAYVCLHDYDNKKWPEVTAVVDLLFTLERGFVFVDRIDNLIIFRMISPVQPNGKPVRWLLPKNWKSARAGKGSKY